MLNNFSDYESFLIKLSRNCVLIFRFFLDIGSILLIDTYIFSENLFNHDNIAEEVVVHKFFHLFQAPTSLEWPRPF